MGFLSVQHNRVILLFKHWPVPQGFKQFTQFNLIQILWHLSLHQLKIEALTNHFAFVYEQAMEHFWRIEKTKRIH